MAFVRPRLQTLEGSPASSLVSSASSSSHHTVQLRGLVDDSGDEGGGDGVGGRPVMRLAAMNQQIEMEELGDESGGATETLLHHVQPRLGGANLPNNLPGSPNTGANNNAPRNDWKVFDQGMRFGCMLSVRGSRHRKPREHLALAP